MSEIRSFAIFGERCSGTNHAQALLKRHLGMTERTDCGWKHAVIRQPQIQKPEETLVLLVVRNLPDWVRSLHLDPHHLCAEMRGAPFAEFIRRSVYSVADHGIGMSPWDRHYLQPMPCDQHKGKAFANVMRMRVHKHRSWLNALNDFPCSFLARHEDLVRQPREILAQIAELCRLSAPLEVEAIKEYKGVAAFGEYRAKPYALISEDDAARMLSQSDEALEKELGYDLLAELGAATAPGLATADQSLQPPDLAWLESVVAHLPAEMRSEMYSWHQRHLLLAQQQKHASYLAEVQHHFLLSVYQAVERDRPKSDFHWTSRAQRAQRHQLRMMGIIS